jgi:hypothetical protein
MTAAAPNGGGNGSNMQQKVEARCKEARSCCCGGGGRLATTRQTTEKHAKIIEKHTSIMREERVETAAKRKTQYVLQREGESAQNCVARAATLLLSTLARISSRRQ